MCPRLPRWPSALAPIAFSLISLFVPGLAGGGRDYGRPTSSPLQLQQKVLQQAVLAEPCIVREKEGTMKRSIILGEQLLNSCLEPRPHVACGLCRDTRTISSHYTRQQEMAPAREPHRTTPHFVVQAPARTQFAVEPLRGRTILFRSNAFLYASAFIAGIAGAARARIGESGQEAKRSLMEY